MRGLCYSALSYPPLFIDKLTVVIGDGDLAHVSTAALATVDKHVRLGCPSVKLKVSNGNEKLKDAKNVTILEGHQVVEVKGDDYAKSVTIKDKQGKISELQADGTFVEMALVPNSQIVADFIALDEQKRIIIDQSNHTNIPGIFAAGDVTNTYAEQVLVAVGEGAKATLSAYEYLLPLM